MWPLIVLVLTPCFNRLTGIFDGQKPVFELAMKASFIVCSSNFDSVPTAGDQMLMDSASFWVPCRACRINCGELPRPIRNGRRRRIHAACPVACYHNRLREGTRRLACTPGTDMFTMLYRQPSTSDESDAIFSSRKLQSRSGPIRNGNGQKPDQIQGQDEPR